MPEQAWQATLPLPSHAGQCLQPDASEQNTSAPTVSAPEPWQKPHGDAPEPEQQSQVEGGGR